MANGKTIFTMNPDFEDIGFVEPPTQEEARALDVLLCRHKARFS
jgi:hypothetical protein